MGFVKRRGIVTEERPAVSRGASLAVRWRGALVAECVGELAAESCVLLGQLAVALVASASRRSREASEAR